jgi:hypothetical protein
MNSTKTAIKSLVLDLRKSLEADIEVGLRRYGITPTALRPLDTLKHLNDSQIAARIRMEEDIRHELGRDESTDDLADAVHWFVREVAFTHLNRLVGLKALEVRRLAPEVIQTRTEYGERSRALRDYRAEHPEAASLPDDGLEDAIKQISRQIYPEFRLLFDVGDPAEMRDAPSNSLLWPSTPTLKACIARINELDSKTGRPGPPAHEKAAAEQSVWAEDEIIGWIYQFYARDERDAIRERDNRRPRPKAPSEAAVLNQFFTHRWLVKFLVDNTLGRLWLEMHPNSSRVRERCNYLVQEPAPGARAVEGERQIQFDPESPINNPDAEPRRAAKRPQDIRLIDPACGTMHFGHYAFEVFQAIYADAREQGWVQAADAVSDEQVPAAILQNNLFGVDIDLRAVQLAALSLFMKAKSANPDAHVGQVNLIVADAHLPRGKVRTDFLAQYASEPIIQQAFQEVFEGLENVAEMGSLLRVEERFRQVLEKAKHPSLGNPVQVKMEVIDGRVTPVHQTGFADLSAAGWQPEYTVEQMLEHLRQFANRALQEHNLNAQLFAVEAEKTINLLDLFLHEYDIVVMNPPFGMAMPSTHETLDALYPDWSDNLLCAFFQRAEVFIESTNGFIGMVSDKTFAVKKSYDEFRKNHFLSEPRLISFLDLGWGVLDEANVEVCALVTSSTAYNEHSLFVDLQAESDKALVLDHVIQNTKKEVTYWKKTTDFLRFPFGAFAYKAPNSILAAFSNDSKLNEKYAYCPSGGMDAPSGQYYRYWWEAKDTEIGRNKTFAPFWNGYAGHSPYYFPHEQVVLWYGNGEKVSKDPKSNMRIRDKYFVPGLIWGKRGDILDIGFSEGSIFSKEGQALFPKKNEDSWPLLAFLNSYVAQFAINLYCGQHKTGGYVGELPIASQIINNSFLSSTANNIYRIKKSWDLGNETNKDYEQSWILLAIQNHLLSDWPELTLEIKSQILSEIVGSVLETERLANAELKKSQIEIDAHIYEYYNIFEQDQIIIEKELSNRPETVIWPYAEKLSVEQKATEHVARLMSYCLLGAIREDPDGILPLSETSSHATGLRLVQAGLEKYFGENEAYQVELDSADYLGRPLGEWLLKKFWKDFHIKWYKKRPILWQLQSPKGHFACLVHIHKMDRDTLPKVRSQYLWPARNACQAALESARLQEDAGERTAAKEVARLETMLDDLNDFEERLGDVIEARVQCDTPDWAQGPYRNGAYDPVLDDGVKVNILPLQEAGILAKKKVV